MYYGESFNKKILIGETGPQKRESLFRAYSVYLLFNDFWLQSSQYTLKELANFRGNASGSITRRVCTTALAQALEQIGYASCTASALTTRTT